jgi:hypothetical protein
MALQLECEKALDLSQYNRPLTWKNKSEQNYKWYKNYAVSIWIPLFSKKKSANLDILIKF